MRRPLSFLFFGLVAFALVASASLIAVAPASAAIAIAPTTTCANSLDNTGGLGLICEVTVVNTITAAGGTATVTVRECHGAAGNPQASCVIQINFLNAPVTKVTQCNGSINGGGGTLRCSVKVTTNFVGMSQTATAATVNQCVGSGGGITKGCKPFPATTTGATITECNGSANGGTLVGLTCTASGTKSSALAVSINQCNGSANGGGALVICSANLSNNTVAAPAPGASPVGGPGVPNASVASPFPAGSDGTSPLVLGGLLLVALSMLALFRRFGDRLPIR
ncbi:MAG: hypothetical protein ABJB65_07610 [Chloroflexota bacterium]